MKQVLTYEDVEFIKAYANKLIAKEDTTKEEDVRFFGIRDKFLEEYEKEAK